MAVNQEIKFEDLFEIKDGIAHPKSARESLIPEIRDIIFRSKGVPGDSDGRKKLYAFRELMAVYYMADVRSLPRKQGLEGEALLSRIRSLTKLEDDWKPDEKVLSCVRFYKNELENQDISFKVLAECISVLRNSLDVLTKINDQLKSELAKPDTTLLDLNQMSATISSVIGLSQKASDEIERLNVTKKKIVMYERNIKRARGGVTVTSSMIPEA